MAPQQPPARVSRTDARVEGSNDSDSTSCGSSLSHPLTPSSPQGTTATRKNHHHRHGGGGAYHPIHSNAEAAESSSSDATTTSTTEAATPNSISTTASITPLAAMLALIKGNVGPGVLNLPHAFGLTGYGLGTLLLGIVACQGMYSMGLLVDCHARMMTTTHREGRPPLTFMSLAQAVLPGGGGAVVEVFLFVSQGGVCCVFLSLLATHVQALTTTTLSDVTAVSLVTMSLLLLVTNVRWIADLVYLNSVANGIMLVALLTATGAGLQRALLHADTPSSLLPAVQPHGAQVGTLLTFTTDMFYALEGMGLVIPVVNAYNGCSPRSDAAARPDPRRVVVSSMTLVAVAFWITGVGAAWGLSSGGIMTGGSIIADLSRCYPHQVWYAVVNTFVVVAVGMTFPLQLTPAAEVVEAWVQRVAVRRRTRVAVEEDDGLVVDDMIVDQDPGVAEDVDENEQRDDDDDEITMDNGGSGCFQYGWIVQRWCMIFFFAAIVLVVDDLGTLMSFFGAVGQTTLAAMPCVLHLAMQYQGLAPPCRWRAALDVIIIVFCAVVMVAGCGQSVWDIMVQREEQHSTGMDHGGGGS